MSAILTAADFPQPSPEALAISEALAVRIRDRIARAGGWVGFDSYMQQALHEPGLGYYSAGSAKFGAKGDFITASDLGEFLARALAAQFNGMLQSFAEPVIVEIGAGSGKLAGQLIDALAELGNEAVRYWILEPSADLRERQRAALQRFGGRVGWLDRLPESPLEGLILANEVIDALPVARFVKRGDAVYPLGVRSDGDRFAWATGGEDPELSEAVDSIESELGESLPDGYRSEVCLILRGWTNELAGALSRGAVLLIDYGLVRREYYHPQRRDGTLICHYRHRAHDDPFFLPGLQDLSAWVDFSACADAARDAGLAVAGFTTQGLYLIESAALSPPPQLASQDPRAMSALKTLVLPGEMGERFKLLLLTKDAGPVHLPGRDFRSRL